MYGIYGEGGYVQVNIPALVMSNGVETSQLFSHLIPDIERFDSLTPLRSASGHPVYVPASPSRSILDFACGFARNDDSNRTEFR